MSTHKVVTNGHEVLPGIPAGCSAPNGHYVSKNAVSTAIELGWGDTEAAEAAAVYDETWFDGEWGDTWNEIVEDAERWLNDHTTGGLWFWFDGDFLLSATEDCPDCGEQRFADPDCQDTVCGEHLSW